MSMTVCAYNIQECNLKCSRCGYVHIGRGINDDVLISEGVVLCTGFNGVELGAEDVSLLERCPLLGPN